MNAPDLDDEGDCEQPDAPKKKIPAFCNQSFIGQGNN